MTAPSATASPQLLVQMRGIVKRFGGGVVANDGVDFDVRAGEIHALLGENGAGKSTLAQILYGMYARDAGEILFEGQPRALAGVGEAIAHGIGMVHQEFMLVETFTVLENVLLGQSRHGLGKVKADAEARLVALSAEFGLGVRPNDRIEDLSIGVRQRVEILKLLFREARVLILDEPTAVLTPAEVDALFGVLRRLVARGRAVVIVTHKLGEIIALADRVTILRAGKVTAAGLATKTVDEATLARLMVGREVLLKLPSREAAPGALVLEAHALCADDDRGLPAVRGVDLALHAGEILAIAGVDGNGQSQLAQALMGLRPLRSGQVCMAGRRLGASGPATRRALGMGYLPADRRGVGGIMAFSLLRNSVLGGLTPFTRVRLWLDHRAIRAHAEALLKRFQVRAASVEAPAGQLSGGNLQKLLLGRELMRNPRFLLLEQPTRGLDVGAIENVWAEIVAQRRSGTAILLISAELEEIFNLADRIAVMCNGRFMGVLRRDEATLAEVGRMMGGEAARGSSSASVSGSALDLAGDAVGGAARDAAGGAAPTSMPAAAQGVA